MALPLPISWLKVCAIGFVSAMVGSLVWGANASPIKKRVEGRALALGGHQSIKTHNNQLRVGFCDRLGGTLVGERGVGRGCIVWNSKWKDGYF